MLYTQACFKVITKAMWKKFGIQCFPDDYISLKILDVKLEAYKANPKGNLREYLFGFEEYLPEAFE